MRYFTVRSLEKRYVKISLRSCALFVDVASLGVKNGSVVEEVVYCSRRCRREVGTVNDEILTLVVQARPKGFRSCASDWGRQNWAGLARLCD